MGDVDTDGLAKKYRLIFYQHFGKVVCKNWFEEGHGASEAKAKSCFISNQETRTRSLSIILTAWFVQGQRLWYSMGTGHSNRFLKWTIRRQRSSRIGSGLIKSSDSTFEKKKLRENFNFKLSVSFIRLKVWTLQKSFLEPPTAANGPWSSGGDGFGVVAVTLDGLC